MHIQKCFYGFFLHFQSTIILRKIKDCFFLVCQYKNTLVLVFFQQHSSSKIFFLYISGPDFQLVFMFFFCIRVNNVVNIVNCIL